MSLSFQLHQVIYVCKDMATTTAFYVDILDLDVIDNTTFTKNK